MNDRVTEARRLVHEHLNASMIMVVLERPIDPSTPIADVLAHLDARGFDLALLDTAEVRLVYRERLRSIPAERRSASVRARAESPRGDRLVEHTLDLGEVARRLLEDDVPLLVIGRRGPEHIVTRSDFTRPAGQAGILAVLAVLDAQLDEFLHPHDHEVWALLTSKRHRAIEALVNRARERDAEVPRLSYLTIRERLEAIRRLRLDRRYGISMGTHDEHIRITAIRNAIAHGREVTDGRSAIQALAWGEQYLDALALAGSPKTLLSLDAASYLERLVGAELRTLGGRPNRILKVEGANAIVGTDRSPAGRPVAIADIESAMEILRDTGRLTIDVATVGYRSAFVGAVLATLPGANVELASPPIVRLAVGY